MTNGIFKTHAPRLRERGLEPRPVKLGTKGCFVRGWPKSDNDLPREELDGWLVKYSDDGVGLRMGTALSGGYYLGCLDIDDDRFVRLALALLNNPPCVRIGKKGVGIFVRLKGKLANTALKIKIGREPDIHVADCLFQNKLVVIPPTIHPDTKQPYRWVDTPICEIDLNALPVIGE